LWDRQAIPIGTVTHDDLLIRQHADRLETMWLPLAQNPLHGRHRGIGTLQNRSQHRASLLAVFSREVLPHLGGQVCCKRLFGRIQGHDGQAWRNKAPEEEQECDES